MQEAREELEGIEGMGYWHTLYDLKTTTTTTNKQTFLSVKRKRIKKKKEIQYFMYRFFREKLKEVSRKLIKQCSTRKTQNISRVSGRECTKAIRLISLVSSGEESQVPRN